jgi:hypothetical protein
MKIRGTDVHELPLHTLSYHACRVIFSSRHPPPAALLEPEVQRGRDDVHSPRIRAHLLREVLTQWKRPNKPLPHSLSLLPCCTLPGRSREANRPRKNLSENIRRCVVDALAVVAGILLIGAFLWTGRVLWYALSGQYEIDQRLDSIGK